MTRTESSHTIYWYYVRIHREIRKAKRKGLYRTNWKIDDNRTGEVFTYLRTRLQLEGYFIAAQFIYWPRTELERLSWNLM